MKPKNGLPKEVLKVRRLLTKVLDRVIQEASRADSEETALQIIEKNKALTEVILGIQHELDRLENP